MEKRYIRKGLVIGVLFLFLGASATLGVSAGAWADNFDTYTLGQLLDGGPDDGGWEGWAGSAAAYGTVTNVQYRSAPHSLDISAGSDLIHRYGDTTGVWTYTAYLYIPTGQSGGSYGGTYFIMQDVYTNGGGDTHWAVQLQFDNVNDWVESEFDGATVPFNYDEWIEIRVEVDFDTDWLEIYINDQFLVEKPWTEGVQGLNDGTLCLASVDLFADGSTSVYYDDMSWVPAGGDFVCDAGGPYSGEIDQPIQFTGFATGGVEPYTWAWEFGDGDTSDVQNPTHAYDTAGTYTATLTVTDATSAVVTDDATVTVIGPQPALEIGTVTGGFGLKASVKNTGTGAATNVDWTITLDGKLVFLGKSSTGTIATLAAAGEEPIKAKFIFGIGNTNIKISASCDEGKTAEVTKTALVLGPFVLKVA
jgi:hypothetical protein